MKLVLGALFLGISSNAIAATGSFNITVQTVPDVVLSTVTPLTYGANMFVTQGGTCFMDATTPGDALADLMQYDGATVAKANYGDLTGAGCVNGLGTGTPGVYKITGISSNTVNITISAISGADFDFAPNSGCIVTYENGAVADTCDAFVPGVSAAKLLPLDNVSESPVTGGTGVTVAGELVFTVGGTVTVGGTNAVDLTAGTSYTQNFPVNVIY
ncbi:hypothetical protein HQQ94_00800 [Shewanella sp. VB17]|uniref:hypothetical protein n=1 Tax=Shewanella sp. VB17 TaxID=2739432 RepID=UPI0015671505|nr:hypothetical protein [Shewanella sp. VB17]NRD71815.1 hypothetical protein [Shewanella sp. VB17]